VTAAPIPTLFVLSRRRRRLAVSSLSSCAGRAPRCGRRVDKVIAGHGSPIPFLRKGSREELRKATGTTKLPALKLADGQ